MSTVLRLVIDEEEHRIEQERVVPIHKEEGKRGNSVNNKSESQNKLCRPDFDIMLKDEDRSLLTVEVKAIHQVN